MSILMAGLQEAQMWAVYQMGMGNEMPISVTKDDLICIIVFLFKQLDWIDDESPSQPSSHTTVKSPILVDSQNSQTQAQNNSVEQLTFEPNKNDENTPLNGNGVNDTNMEVAEDSTHVDQNGEKNQDTHVENNKLLVDSENNSGDDALEVMETSLQNSSKLEFGCSLCDQKFSKESFVAAHMWMRHKTNLKGNSTAKNFS